MKYDIWQVLVRALWYWFSKEWLFITVYVLLQNVRTPRTWVQVSQQDTDAWSRLKALAPTEPLPEDMPASFYFKLSSHMQCGKYAEQLDPYMKLFGPEK